MLSERQIQLLNAIINEYITSSQPVGSVELVDKYKLRYSAATVRNEMARLIEMGFLQMLHASSGRIPTKMAYRLYLDQLMEEEELPVLQEVSMKQRLWESRFEFEKLLREATLALANNAKSLTIITTDDGFMTSAGTVHILDNPEFWDIDLTKEVLAILDDYDKFNSIIKSVYLTGDVGCVIEEEIGSERLRNCAFIFSTYNTGRKRGIISLLGPSRINYASVIPALRYTKNLVEELGGAW